ncbi:hypothetical protein Hanom_Chr01g00092441 [Helianthus anomalus]
MLYQHHDDDERDNTRKHTPRHRSERTTGRKNPRKRTLFTVEEHFRRKPITAGNIDSRCQFLSKRDHRLLFPGYPRVLFRVVPVNFPDQIV